ncbi:putative fructosyl amino acid protein [Bombardia bombarda]|uniref:Fructosyl amino acid protein n=1 Tax=Bombardia bombarda TaxID=252184 RepID=A0AA39X885_9PEZI|nr:putative fructosyl amino acid protein [Bombardia bombarda]
MATSFSPPSSSHSSSSSPLPPPSHPPPPTSFSPPSSILIIGSGVFGLSTAWALARRDVFSQCSITVVDRSGGNDDDVVFPARDAASIDTSRIIRADYPDPAYAALAAEAQVEWRKQSKPTDLGAQGRYNESGLVLVADGVPPSPPTASSHQPPATPTAAIDKTKLTGMDYARCSWANVLSLASSDPDLAQHIRELPNPAAIAEAVATGGGSSGSWGYINQGSGWADAAASMAWLFDKVQQTGRVTFVAGTVAALEHTGTVVTGAKLADGRVMSADLVVLAAGAWTGDLVDMSGRAIATGQVLGYMDITEDEQQQLSKMPVVLNLSTGLFVIPPANRVLKVARHAYGYVNPTTLATAPLSSTTSYTASRPLTQASDPTLSIPAEGEEDIRRALQEMVPLPSLRDCPFTKTRLCWYSDTATADFLIDYHPEWQGLFVACGDSGHAFKFMPVIGDKIADCITRSCPPEFRGKWDWKQVSGDEAVITEDGSRGGMRGLVLADELRKTKTSSLDDGYEGYESEESLNDLCGWRGDYR